MHYKSTVIRSTPKTNVRRPRSERKKSKVNTQTPSKFKQNDSQMYHVNILTPGKIQQYNEKMKSPSAMKTTAATMKSNIRAENVGAVTCKLLSLF